MSDEFHRQPGSPEAVALGCTCPPQIGPDAVYDVSCPIHAAADRVESDLQEQVDPNAS